LNALSLDGFKIAQYPLAAPCEGLMSDDPNFRWFVFSVAPLLRFPKARTSWLMP